MVVGVERKTRGFPVEPGAWFNAKVHKHRKDPFMAVPSAENSGISKVSNWGLKADQREREMERQHWYGVKKGKLVNWQSFRQIFFFRLIFINNSHD